MLSVYCMETKKPLEEKVDEEIRPIYPPEGKSKQDTEEVIRALSTVLKSNTWFEFKEHTKETIRRIVKGYEQQSGQKYDGFLPEEMKDGDKKPEYNKNKS